MLSVVRALVLTLLLTPSGAFAAMGGPDAGGYVWADSYESVGPFYNPMGAAFGSTVSLGDDDSQVVTIPFSFDWYGTSYTSLYINSNGVISFGASQTNTTVDPCGTAQTVPFAAPWWVDLDPPNNGSIRYDTHGSTGTRVFVVQWEDVEAYPNSTGFATFEVQLHEIDDHVEFHYEDVTFSLSGVDNGADGFVGMGDGGSATTEIYCDDTALSLGYAIGLFPGFTTGCDDDDGDGYEDDACGGLDCDDSNASVNPGATEVCDYVDNDCDSSIDEGFDQDNDGWLTCDGDCDDTTSSANPGQSEDCFDFIDNDCDGATDSSDSDCQGGDDDDATGDDDDATGDDDDATGDDDDATGDDDDATGDDDDATGDDDDATGDDDDAGDDDDSASTGDDDDDDDDGGGGGRSSRRACSQTASGPGAGWVLFGVIALAIRRRR